MDGQVITGDANIFNAQVYATQIQNATIQDNLPQNNSVFSYYKNTFYVSIKIIQNLVLI